MIWLCFIRRIFEHIHCFLHISIFIDTDPSRHTKDLLRIICFHTCLHASLIDFSLQKGTQSEFVSTHTFARKRHAPARVDFFFDLTWGLLILRSRLFSSRLQLSLVCDTKYWGVYSSHKKWIAAVASNQFIRFTQQPHIVKTQEGDRKEARHKWGCRLYALAWLRTQRQDFHVDQHCSAAWNFSSAIQYIQWFQLSKNE